MTETRRLYFLDNLRVVCMMVVIAHHVGQACGPTGGWWPVLEPVRAEVLGPFFMVNRSFGMSLFFMIAGYFTVMSYDRSGPSAFLRSRLQRLGLPLVWYVLAMTLLQVFVLDAKDGRLGSPLPAPVGHLWFVEHLLVYSAGYALWRTLWPARVGGQSTLAPVPGYGTILAAALALATATAATRFWFPIDHWEQLFGVLRVAFADVPRDLTMFVVGVVAYRRQWVTRFPTRAGMVWFVTALGLAAFWYAFDLWFLKVAPIQEPLLGAITAVWESVLCFGMCIGLTVLFRERANVTSKLWAWLAQAQYATYIFHVFVVIAFQVLLLQTALPPLVKFVLVSAASIPASFLVAGLVRKPLRL